MDYMPTVVFDFDGVIHSYKSGWKGAGVIPDPIVPGITDVIDQLREHGYIVVVVSTRYSTQEGMEAVKDYLTKNGIIVDDVLAEKPPAVCYIDDRAICFRGNTEKLVDQIKKFRSWVEDPKVQFMDRTDIRLDMSLISDEEREALVKKLANQPCVVLETDPSPVEQLRPCKGVYWDKGTPVEVAGRFHGWGTSYQEFDEGPGNFTTALVERDDGQVFECNPGTIFFLDIGTNNEEGR